MCGIAGTVGAPPDHALLEAMAQMMIKRGPDGQATWADEQAGLAATRLAIIDLHERSDQPMHVGHLHLVFNGEIYNYRELRDELRALGHRFETEGDAEVLLHAWAEWGEGALERFNAMFAFAIWDDASEQLTLASDPFGEKPVYYATPGGRFVFASEIKAILLDPAVRAEADESVLAEFVARHALPPVDRSFFRGIKRLPAAHVLTYANGRIATRRYWQPQRVAVPPTYGETVEELRELVLDSIRLRLRSDVPVGTSLSGGIDSSTVVVLSAQLAGDHTRHAFTARFPGFARDEWPYASEVATAAGVAEHHAVEPTVDGVLDDLDRLVVDHEEPVGSLSIYAQWRVMQTAREHDVTVLLDGQGGDELFSGYPATVGFALRGAGFGAMLRALAADRGQAGDVALAYAFDYLPLRLRRLHRRRTAAPYASADAVELSEAATVARIEPWARERDPLRRQLLIQCFETSLPHLLRYADRSSMAWSREVRLPFLDRRIAELALSLPARYVYRDGVSKRVLRDAARGLVPESVLARRDKVGFEPPQREWLQQPAFRERIAEVLLDPAARARGLYDAEALADDLRTGSWRDSDGVWRALNAELWLRNLVEAREPLASAA